MKIARTERFKKAYARLSDRDKGAVDKALFLLASNLAHPGLQAKKVEGAKGVWEARASRSIRMTFEVTGNTLLLRNVGAHDTALKRP